MTALGGLTASAAILLFVLGDGIPLT
jgi:hypothetical protein